MNDTTTSTPGERDVRQQVPLWRLTGTFTLLTPLHVGTGRDAEIRLDEERMGSDKETRAQDESRYIATVVRDHQDRPCIPASSFKGALAALARRAQVPGGGQAGDAGTDHGDAAFEHDLSWSNSGCWLILGRQCRFNKCLSKTYQRHQGDAGQRGGGSRFGVRHTRSP